MLFFFNFVLFFFSLFFLLFIICFITLINSLIQNLLLKVLSNIFFDSHLKLSQKYIFAHILQFRITCIIQRGYIYSCYGFIIQRAHSRIFEQFATRLKATVCSYWQQLFDQYSFFFFFSLKHLEMAEIGALVFSV